MDRRPMQVRLTDRSRAGWDKYTRERGVSLTALLEVIGGRLADRPEGKPAPSDVAAVLDRVLEDARRLDFERKSRG